MRALAAALVAALAGTPAPPLGEPLARIALPDVAGRLDHLALDAAGRRLFVAALESGTVEVVDLAANRRIRRIEGFAEPQGLAFLPRTQTLFVTNGEGAAVSLLRGRDLAPARRTALRQDPDNIREEPGAARVWVGEGTKADGALAALDAETGAVSFEIALDGHPESFQLEARSPRIFVNVPAAQEVEVVDRVQRRAVSHFELPCAANFPMALDEERQRLFVVCRRPAELVVLDTASGKTLAERPAPADADDVYLDAARGRVYVSGGAGAVRVYARGEHDRIEIAGDVATGPGARTSLLAPESHRLYVAVPRRGAAPAQILIFDTGG